MVNRNAIPFDKKTPQTSEWYEAWRTISHYTWMGDTEMDIIGDLILEVINNLGDNNVERRVKNEVLQLTSQFYSPELT
ncbi:MAG: hypothetical protein CM1200mP3_18630 [Chloroflexota bacterium]|nr:MAG: hypothetical protein CM1200mP3_18630 [Chloroflexota bacterium]